VNGLGDIVSIKISKDIVKQAIENGKAMAQGEMGKLTAGLGLPPGLM
jgi:hypothetical protein